MAKGCMTLELEHKSITIYHVRSHARTDTCGQTIRSPTGNSISTPYVLGRVPGVHGNGGAAQGATSLIATGSCSRAGA